MTKALKWARGVAAFGLLVAATGAATALPETMNSNLRYVRQVSSLTCDDISGGWQHEVCASAEMRLKLCEKGLIPEPALSPVVYECFLRSQ